jgi:hypothetical protein
MQIVRFCFEGLQTVKLNLNFKTWKGTEGVIKVRCVKFEETKEQGILVLLYHVACLDIHTEGLGGVQKIS